MSSSGKRVFLTGASGFVASHILADLIHVGVCPLLQHPNQSICWLTVSSQCGYQTTASVRSEKKVQEILELHPEWVGKVNFVLVKDIVQPGAFDDVFKQAKSGFDYIIHTASPVNFSVTDFQKDLIDPAVGGSVIKSIT